MIKYRDIFEILAFFYKNPNEIMKLIELFDKLEYLNDLFISLNTKMVLYV